MIKTNSINNVYCMAELAIRSVRKMMYTDWLLSRAISFSYRPTKFSGESFRVQLKTSKPDSCTFYK